VNVTTELSFTAGRTGGEVSALLLRPDDARWLYVFGHGAGAGMRHRLMEAAAGALAAHGVATLRYQFPYMEQRSRRPDPPPILHATVRAAVAAAREAAPDLPLLAGGRSMGGRMTSQTAASGEGLEGVRGLVFYAFPLHPTGAPAATRAEHLDQVPQPMLFLQGTRDKLADLDLLRPVLSRLGDRATLHVVDGADHSFALPKSAGRSEADVNDELAKTASEWAQTLKAEV
jgi:predicted alpha/beta-hydrolase family hydrolase